MLPHRLDLPWQHTPIFDKQALSQNLYPSRLLESAFLRSSPHVEIYM